MKYPTQILLFLLLVYTSLSTNAENIVQGVYQNDLTIYSKEGKRLNDVSKAYRNVTDEEINGTPILESTPRNLVKIHFRDTDVWIRSSQLRISMKKLAACPDSAPGRPEDTNTPISSGMGAECDPNK